MASTDVLLGYDKEAQGFTPLQYPQNCTGWDYEIVFHINGARVNGYNGTHFIYCRDFADLTAVLNILRPILLNEQVKSHYTYRGPKEKEAINER